jgi:hypothetical protein
VRVDAREKALFTAWNHHRFGGSFFLSRKYDYFAELGATIGFCRRPKDLAQVWSFLMLILMACFMQVYSDVHGGLFDGMI